MDSLHALANSFQRSFPDTHGRLRFLTMKGGHYIAMLNPANWGGKERKVSRQNSHAMNVSGVL